MLFAGKRVNQAPQPTFLGLKNWNAPFKSVSCVDYDAIWVVDGNFAKTLLTSRFWVHTYATLCNTLIHTASWRIFNA
jgi:hypothetical protein